MTNSRLTWIGTATGAWAILCAAMVDAQDKDPPVPAGADPGGVAVALISGGSDYRIPEIAQALARDGEGTLIGWDFIDNDETPFFVADADEAKRLTAAAKAENTQIRLIVVRADLGNPVMRAQALAYVARTPARIVVLPGWLPTAQDHKLLETAAEKAPHLLIVIQGFAAASDNKPPPAPPGTTLVTGISRHPAEAAVKAARHVAANPDSGPSSVRKSLEAAR